MSRRLLRIAGIGVAAGAALVWMLLSGLDWPARAYTTFLLVPLPALLLVQTRLLDGIPEPGEREAVYLSSAVSIWTLAAFAMLAARFSDFSRADLWLVLPGWRTLFGAAALTTAAGVALMAGGRLLRLTEADLVRYLMPGTGSEKIAFAGLSVSAGIGEELVFRSFLMASLLAAGASLPLTIVLSIAVFAISHAYQGVTGVIRVTLLGALLTAPVLLTGSVYPSMLAHAALDLIAGLLLSDWLVGKPEH